MDVKFIKEINLFFFSKKVGKSFKIQYCYFFPNVDRFLSVVDSSFSSLSSFISNEVVAQKINSSEWCLRSWVRSYPGLPFYFFSCSKSPENSGSVKNRRRKACIYPALIREIFSRCEPLSSGVIMCMYGNFTFRLVTVWFSYLIAHVVD